MTRRLLLLALLLALAAPAWAAGTVTTTTSEPYTGTYKYTLTWVCDAAGTVSAQTAVPLLGRRIVRVTIVPATVASGIQPTDLYDATLLDEYGSDLLNIDGSAKGTNLSNVNALTLVVNPTFPLSASTVTLGVTNAGNAKGGTVIVWVER